MIASGTLNRATGKAFRSSAYCVDKEVGPMQEIMDALKQAAALLSSPDATRKDRSRAIAALEEAQRRLDTFVATLKAQRR
jgi:hypothetical protein